MRQMRLWAIGSFVIVAGMGCATALNMQDDSLHQPYGGVTMSLFNFSGGGERAEDSALIMWPFWLLDKPLSLFADTLTLPYILWTQQASQTSTARQIPPYSSASP